MSTPGAADLVSSVARMTMRVASTWSTMPERRAMMATPESRATVSSMPVPTSGASARISGTAWRCMFEPISARLASSFSRNGISAAATETSCFGETSMKSMSSGRRHDEIAAVPAGDQVGGEAPLGIELGIGLGDGVAPFVHRREIDDLVGDLAVVDLAVRAFDEAVLVDPGIGREPVDQADIRAFRRLDRADAAVMRRMHVAHLEAGALAGQTARPERREAPLVGDLRQRIGLVHELRELRRAEELAHRGRRRLGVDQIVRHHGVDLDRAHALADRPLHAQQADAVLVLHQLADRAHAAVAEMVDVVDLAAAVLQVDQHLEDREDVLLAQHAHLVALAGRIARQRAGASSS